MVQVRKLVLAIAAASALSSGMAQALGLGELTLKSTQNQPLLAEIELLDIKDLTAAEVVPSLAPPEEFTKAGVQRPAFLNDLRFTSVINPEGKSVLRVTSTQPLSEPFVKFLVQVMWPNGRLLRDYSVLLDPAKFSPQTAAAASASAKPAAAGASTQYTTSARDTLWEIAAKSRNGGSVQQTMLAIQALNPDAFINGNINRLKTGQVLRLPDAAQSTQLPHAKAMAQVAAQNADWRNGRRTAPQAQQVDATGRKAAPLAPAKAAAGDNLSLVSAQAAKAAGKGAAGDAQNLSDKLATTQEGLDASRRENAELKSRMQDLQSQLDKLQRLIELKNDQLAKLQAGNAPGTEAVAAAPAQLVAQAPDSPEADIEPATEGTPATAVPPAPVEEDASTEERSIQDLLSSPLLLGLIGGGAVLLLLMLMLLLARRRKAQQAAEKHLRMARALEEESEFAADLEMPESSFEGLEVAPPSVKLEPAPAPAPAPAPVVESVAPVVAAAAVAAAAVAAAATQAKPDTDVLVEAEHLITRRQFQEAEELLKSALEQAPQRSDLRLKLMQVHGELGERDAFIAQERQLVANGKNHAEVEQLKSRYPAMVAVAAGGIASAAVAAELEAQFVKDMLEDEPVSEPKVEPAPEAPLAADEFEHDFDLSLDDLETASPADLAPESSLEATPVAVDDALSFEAVMAQQAEAQASSEDLSGFDLDVSADEQVAPTLVDDDLLGLEDELKGLSDVESPLFDVEGLDDLEMPADFDLSLADEDVPAAPDSFSVELDEVNAELERLSQSLEHPPLADPLVNKAKFEADDAVEQGEEPEFDFLSGADEAATKLDLAQAYVDMGDVDGARDILSEVLEEGTEVQRNEAKEILANLR